jgi:hypothetical protein
MRICTTRTIIAAGLAAMFAAGLAPAARAAAPSPYFAVHVVDDQTGRGVPLVELETVNNVLYVTDSSGLAAVHEPGLEGQEVYFKVRSHGYEVKPDGFGMRGFRAVLKPGGEHVFKIKRLNVAERLYRITGGDIYRDTILLGRKAPTALPLLCGKVVGQDSVQIALYRGKIRWFWGDTNRPSYPLGHFGMAGAVSDPPGKGGLDPALGVNLEYFVGPNGFSRPMVHLDAKGMFWIDGLMVLPDETGRERLLCRNEVHASLTDVTRKDILIYNDEQERFEPLLPIPMDAPLYPSCHPVRHKTGDVEHFHVPTPYAVMRVRADWKSVRDLASYEGFTCLKAGARFDKRDPALDRDADGRLVWGWKKDTATVSEVQQNDLIKAGKMREDEAWFRIKDVETGDTVQLHGGSIAWNPYRKRWVMIAVQQWGKPSMLGEVWYAEAGAIEGPWRHARRIVTHDRYSFYNPKHHPFFDQDGGRLIYFEGTYSMTFSRDHSPTPRYDYNQVMYRLDLSDPRLKMPKE